MTAFSYLHLQDSFIRHFPYAPARSHREQVSTDVSHTDLPATSTGHPARIICSVSNVVNA